MKRILLFVLTVLVMVFSASFVGAIDAQYIIKEADKARAPGDSFSFELEVISKKPDRKDEISKFKILVKGRDKSLVKFTYPKRDKGKVMLMVGNNLWIYIPTSRNPIRISQQQRLIGQVSNGDVVRTNFSQDYFASLLEEIELEGKNCYLLELIAKSNEVAYHRIIYWVEKGSFNPVKSEFYTISGKLLKSAYYQGYKDILGRERITQMVIADNLREGQTSIMEYSNMKIEEFPDHIFQKSYLKHVK